MRTCSIRLSIGKFSFIAIAITIFYDSFSIEFTMKPVPNIKLKFVTLWINLLACSVLNPFTVHHYHFSSILFTILISLPKFIINLTFHNKTIFLHRHTSICYLFSIFNILVIHSFKYWFIVLINFLK